MKNGECISPVHPDMRKSPSESVAPMQHYIRSDKTVVREPLEASVVREACISAWRMRNVKSIQWGVRDWKALRFEVERNENTLRTVVTIFGASEDSALRFFVWEKLGSPSRVDVICREAGDGK